MSTPHRKLPLKALLAVLAVGLVAFAFSQLPIKDALVTFNEAVASWGTMGVIVFILVYAIAAVFLIPASILTLGAGFTFGLPLGMLAVSMASTLGAALSFLVSRYVARNKVKEKFGQSDKFTAVDKAISHQGWKIVALLRLSPVFPYNALNYILGLTGIKFSHYVVASWAGMLPGTLLYVYFGFLGKAGLESASGGGGSDFLRWIYMGLGLLATLAVTIYVTKLAKKAMEEKTDMETDT